jgi:hypothetical protein
MPMLMFPFLSHGLTIAYLPDDRVLGAGVGKKNKKKDHNMSSLATLYATSHLLDCYSLDCTNF